MLAFTLVQWCSNINNLAAVDTVGSGYDLLRARLCYGRRRRDADEKCVCSTKTKVDAVV